jgi:hypothetical protein
MRTAPAVPRWFPVQNQLICFGVNTAQVEQLSSFYRTGVKYVQSHDEGHEAR